jgi:hypothetical protein
VTPNLAGEPVGLAFPEGSLSPLPVNRPAFINIALVVMAIVLRWLLTLLFFRRSASLDGNELAVSPWVGYVLGQLRAKSESTEGCYSAVPSADMTGPEAVPGSTAGANIECRLAVARASLVLKRARTPIPAITVTG